MNLKIVFYYFCFCILTGCSLGVKTTITKKYPPGDPLEKIIVLDKLDPVPSDAIELGVVKIFDNMTVHCDSVTVFNAAKNEVRKAGGNILKVTEHKYPNIMSSCHQINGIIFRTNIAYDSARTQPATVQPAPTPPAQQDFRLALNGGWSWQTAKISNSLNSFERDYLEKLKSGFHYGGEFDFFVGEATAVSIQFNQFHSSNSANASAQLANGSIVTGTLSDKIDIMYVAPGIMWRVQSPTKINAFLFGLSLGYMHYKDEGNFLTSTEVSGNNFGISYDLGYDIGLSKSTALGLGFSWKIGTLTSVRMTQNGISQTVKFNDNERLGIGHLDLSLGLRFR
jgi:hypothetical protein